MQKYALFMFFIAKCYGFPETAFFFFWKFNFCPFQSSVALEGTVNNSTDIILKGTWQICQTEEDNEF